MPSHRQRWRLAGPLLAVALVSFGALWVIASQFLQEPRFEPIFVTHESVPASVVPMSAQAIEQQRPPVGPLTDAERSRLAVAAFEAVSPAVVIVHRVSRELTQENRSLDPGERIGTGIAIDEQGHIIASLRTTGATGTIRVTYATGETVSATIVRVDELYQLVLLKAERPPPATAAIAAYAPRPGDIVLAIGTPLEDFSSTVTGGLVGAVGVTMPPIGARDPIPDAVQHDAATNAGNEGGPLIDLTGRVVAINVGSIVERDGEIVQGWSFAVPVILLTPLLADLG